MPSTSNSRQSIQQLSTQLANQIAAGEVVERPASVIKELLENSLDAGATQIDIEIKAGGTQLIRIRDNGSGIPKEELSLALSPHATSKIRSLDDLIHVYSMGFRGEALASIASVSEVVLTSCFSHANGETMAWSIKAKEGCFDLSPASHPAGTTLEVSNLFYNTPARRKFLKAERTEYKHIEDIVKRIALARFDVAINFKHNQRQVFALTAASSIENKRQRLARLINKEFIASAVELDFESAGLKLTGWLANADYSRSQSDMQYFFVNGRMIRDKVITHAVRQAFQNTLYPGRFPVYVLNLEMDAEQVDVNVHPTKHEVRFRQGRLVHDFLFYSLREALSPSSPSSQSESHSDSGDATAAYPSGANNSGFNQSAAAYEGSRSGFVSESANAYSASASQNIENSDALTKPLGVAIAKVKNNYLLAQNQHGLLIVQLTTARKVLLQQQIKLSLSTEEKLISKPVLIPFSQHLTVNAQSWLDKKANSLRQYGFEFAVLGEQQIMVRQVPALLNATDIKKSIALYIENILEKEMDFLPALIDIVVNDDFSHHPAEWNNVLRELEKLNLDEMKHCYHQLTDKELASWFKS